MVWITRTTRAWLLAVIVASGCRHAPSQSAYPPPTSVREVLGVLPQFTTVPVFIVDGVRVVDTLDLLRLNRATIRRVEAIKTECENLYTGSHPCDIVMVTTRAASRRWWERTPLVPA